MKSDYVTRAKHFINQFFNSWDIAFIGENFPIIEQRIADYNFAKHRHVKFNYGMSRVAFITSDYVIKIDYHKCWAGNCIHEYTLYQDKIKNSPYSYLFAEITQYIYNGIAFYIMPRIYGIDENREEDVDSFLNYDEERFVRDILCIHDLHSGNYGWKNKKVVIIDYAYYEKD